MLLGVKKQTSNIAARAELGRFPIFIEIYVSMVKYWLRLNNTPSDRLTNDALYANLHMQEAGLYTWTSMIQFILEQSDFKEVWINKTVTNVNKFLKTLKIRLQANYTEMFKSSMNNDIRKNNKQRNKLRTYRSFKNDHEQENYLTTIRDTKIRSSVTKMRLSNHHLMIEKGRHLGLELEKRICNKCNMNLIEDEKHALMICPVFKDERTRLFTLLALETAEWNDFNVDEKFIQIMKLRTQPIRTGQFIYHIMNWEPN